MKIKGLTKKHHVYTDYTYVALIFAGPMLAGFSANKLGRLTCGTFAFSALTYILCTKAKWSVVKLIPYKLRSVLDLISGVFGLAFCCCLLLGLYTPEIHLSLMGILGLVVVSLSLIGAQKSKKTHQIIYTY